MKNNYFVLIVIGLVIATAVALKIFSFSSNHWICEDGTWVKQGNPKTEKPIDGCEDPFSMKKELSEMSAILNQMETDNSKKASSTDLDLITSVDDSKEPDYVKTDTIVELLTPQLGETIESPYQITGLARGNWYFEASFPIILKASDGTIIAETIAQAQSDWMTEEMVPFIAELNYTVNTPQVASLILKKDNPSGLPENDAEVSYSIFLN